MTDCDDQVARAYMRAVMVRGLTHIAATFRELGWSAESFNALVTSAADAAWRYDQLRAANEEMMDHVTHLAATAYAEEMRDSEDE